MTIKLDTALFNLEFEPQDTPMGMVIEGQTRIMIALSESFAKAVGQEVGQQIAKNMSPEQMLELQKHILNEMSKAAGESFNTVAKDIAEEIENHPVTQKTEEVIDKTPGGRMVADGVKTLWKYSPAGIITRRLLDPK